VASRHPLSERDAQSISWPSRILVLLIGLDDLEVLSLDQE
jgi:hypothetical protein